MPLVFLTLRFDERMDHMVRGLWTLLDGHGDEDAVPLRHRPHITLAAYDVGNVEGVCTILPEFTRSRSVFSLCLDSLGVFPETGTVFLAPRMTAALFSAHRELAEFASPLWGPSLYPEHLLPDAWTPHCTLASGLSKNGVAQVISICQQHWYLIDGRIEAIGVLVQSEKYDHCEAPFSRPAAS